MKPSVWNPANAVTASRYLTLLPFAWAVHHGHNQYATLLLVVCGLLDKVDGTVARRFGCGSAFGEVFDAMTDGICHAFCLLVTMAYGWAPAVPTTIVLLLGAFNVTLRVVYARRAKRLVNYRSYSMERLSTYGVYLVGIAAARYDAEYFFWAFVLMMAVSVARDTKRMLIDPVPSSAGALA